MLAASVRGISSVAIVAVCGAWPAAAQSSVSARVSIAPDGSQANQGGFAGDLSADLLFVGFSSSSTNLFPGDTNQTEDVFLHTRSTGALELISVNSQGVQANDLSSGAALSDDGRYVAFGSLATNLATGDNNDSTDVFVRDRLNAVTSCVSVGYLGLGNGLSWNPSISDKGRYVAFESYATNLVPNDTNGVRDVFLHDRSTGLTTRISVTSGGSQANDESMQPAVSGDGRWVAFASRASNLHKGDANGNWDVFVHEIASGTTQIVSLNSAGQVPPEPSVWPHLSYDGQAVVFQSSAALVPTDTNNSPDIYLHDLSQGGIQLVSVDSNGGPSNGASHHPTVSAAGTAVAFESLASDLVVGDTNQKRDVFLRNLGAKTTYRVSVSTANAQGNDDSEYAVVSSDGLTVLFSSKSSNLVPGDSNVSPDAFVRELSGCTTTVGTYCTASTTSIPACKASLWAAGTPRLSAPGLFQVHSGAMPGGMMGIAYFGAYGPSGTPFGTQGGYLCVKSPLWRAAGHNSGGTKGQCNGDLVYTLQDLLAVPGTPIVAGYTVHMALWFRDPPNPDGYSLSNGLWFRVCP